MGYFLDYAGRRTCPSKGKKVRKNGGKRSPFEQTLYEAIMESLGYKNKEPFQLASCATGRHPMLDSRGCSSTREEDRYASPLLGAAGIITTTGGFKNNI